jgi:hypothetical protein
MVHLGVKKSSSTEVYHGPPRNFRNFVLEGHGPTSEVLRYLFYVFLFIYFVELAQT